MAPSYDPADAYNAITPQLGNVSLDSTAKGTVADNACKWLWNFAPWRWERKSLSAFSLTDDTQTYTAAVPSDFMQLLQAEVVVTSDTPDTVRELDIKNWVDTDPTEKMAPVSLGRICYLQELNSGVGGFKIPNPSIPSGTTATIRGVYRATPATKYTSANLTTDFTELPDQYFHVYQEVLLWMVYRYIGDSRAGHAQSTSGGRIMYTGQLGVMMDAVGLMFNAEDYADTNTIFPSESLGPTSSSRYPMFP